MWYTNIYKGKSNGEEVNERKVKSFLSRFCVKDRNRKRTKKRRRKKNECAKCWRTAKPYVSCNTKVRERERNTKCV